MPRKVPATLAGNQSLEEFGKKLVSFRFAVLHHQMPADSERASHWDVLLEQPPEFGSGLLTFEVSVPPNEWRNPISIRKLPDHRPIYLHYDGQLSDNRGIVTRILTGTIQWRLLKDVSLILCVQSDLFPSGSLSNVDRAFTIQGELRISKLGEQSNHDRWTMEYTHEFGSN